MNPGKKEIKMTLSEKEQGTNERYFHKKDVKQFIKDLKEVLNNIDGDLILVNTDDIINKLAGKELIE